MLGKFCEEVCERVLESVVNKIDISRKRERRGDAIIIIMGQWL